jgi:hypothetical protein
MQYCILQIRALKLEGVLYLKIIYFSCADSLCLFIVFLLFMLELINHHILFACTTHPSQLPVMEVLFPKTDRRKTCWPFLPFYLHYCLSYLIQPWSNINFVF